MEKVIDVVNRIKGALFGVAVGDALGAPLEFLKMDEIKAKYGKVTTMIGGGVWKVDVGQCTDDTDMTIAVARGIVDCPSNPVAAVGKYFVEWLHNDPIDVGVTCKRSILYASNRLRKSQPSDVEWYLASKRIAHDNGNRSAGNGALMRTVYPALYYHDLNRAIEVAQEIALMTHWDKSSTTACRIYTQLIHFLLLREDGVAGKQLIEENLEGTRYRLAKPEIIKPSGYVVDSFDCALYSLSKTDNFKDALVEAVNLGGDSDTIGAIVGGMAGALYGYEEIPKEWIDALHPKMRKQLDDLARLAIKNRLEK